MAEKFFYSSIFGNLTKQIQLRFDAVSRLHKQLFNNVFYERFSHGITLRSDWISKRLKASIT